MTTQKTEAQKPINLALQGGGSHGAYTWGVLDALLEDGRLVIASVSGTSAGAMNAVALAAGFAENGAEGAREKLRQFWTAVGEKSRYSPVQRSPFNRMFGNWSLKNSPVFRTMDVLSRFYSPYDLNPLGFNPLRDVLEDVVDFDRVRACVDFKIFISATNVQTGKTRLFTGDEISADAVMASACLPSLYQAVEIDGVPYWDGGFGGNPALYPFFYESDVEDCLLVQINPIERDRVPKTALEIQERVNEITFNSALLAEFRAIEFVRRLKADGRLEGTDYRSIRMHRIAADDFGDDVTPSSKLNAEPAFLSFLFDLGRAAAFDFLEQHFEQIGKEPSLDLSEELRSDILKPRKKGFVGRHLSALKNRRQEK